MDLRLNGLNPLSYVGVNPYTPVPLILQRRDPTPADSQNVSLGTLWLNQNTNGLWYLANLNANVATWILFTGGSGANLFEMNAGQAVPFGGLINVFGVNQIDTQGDNMHTITISLLNGLNGQVLIGGGVAPVWNNITSLGGTVVITNGPNSINLETATGGGTVTALRGDDAGLATAVLGVIDVFGDANIHTTGAANILRIHLNNNIHITGNFQADGNLDIGGTVRFNSFGIGVLQADAVGNIFSSNGTDGQVLIAASAGAPAWRNLTAGANITITNAPNSITIASPGGGGFAGQDAFFAYQNVSEMWNGFPLGTDYTVGQNGAWTIVVDNGGNVNPGGGGIGGQGLSFTAPATGIYQINAYFEGSGWIGFWAIVNPAAPYRYQMADYTTTQSGINGTRANPFNQAIPMNIHDILTFVLQVSPGPTVSVIFGMRGVAPFNYIRSYISGYRVA